MRVLKFRIWDKENKQIHYCDAMGIMDNGIWFENSNFDTDNHNDDEAADVMQFTGLHDRNGKEIYADDILKDSVGHLFRVYACIGGFAIKAEYWRNDLSDLIIGDELILTSLIDAQMQIYVSGSVEIIGNRFENPELM